MHRTQGGYVLSPSARCGTSKGKLCRARGTWGACGGSRASSHESDSLSPAGCKRARRAGLTSCSSSVSSSPKDSISRRAVEPTTGRIGEGLACPEMFSPLSADVGGGGISSPRSRATSGIACVTRLPVLETDVQTRWAPFCGLTMLLDITLALKLPSLGYYGYRDGADASLISTLGSIAEWVGTA